MPYQTDHLAKLHCAARAAEECGYVHTEKALRSMIESEEFRLRLKADGENPARSD